MKEEDAPPTPAETEIGELAEAGLALGGREPGGDDLVAEAGIFPEDLFIMTRRAADATERSG